MKAATGEIENCESSIAFQSTPPVKAATWCKRTYGVGFSISIHAAREGGDVRNAAFFKFVGISIHAAREGGDSSRLIPSSDGAISIHAAREGGDGIYFSAMPAARYFNPRRP